MKPLHRAIVATAAATIAIGGMFVGMTAANAIPQSNPSFPTVSCGGTWHWVHNQLPAGTTGGTLTATFAKAGTVTITGVLKPGGATVHYTTVLATGDHLVSASDTITGGKLLLSNFPTCTSPSGLPSGQPSGGPSGFPSGQPSGS
jgi:hypothetical protein